MGNLMRVLIAGGFGFAGGRLANYMHRAGYQVILGSRKASEPPDWLPRAEVARLDWNSVDALEAACSGADVVIQAAGMNAQDCAADPVAALMVNGVATARLMEAAGRAAVKRFVYLSTAHVYGSPPRAGLTKIPVPATCIPTHPAVWRAKMRCWAQVDREVPKASFFACPMGLVSLYTGTSIAGCCSLMDYANRR